MNKIYSAGIAALIAAAIAGPTFATGGVQGRDTVRPKHDSNSLHKLGNAVQYPFRKAGENASVDSHRTSGRDSLIKNDKRGTTETVKPNGDTEVVAVDNNRHDAYGHRHHNINRQGRRYYRFNSHRYYLNLRTNERVMVD